MTKENRIAYRGTVVFALCWLWGSLAGVITILAVAYMCGWFSDGTQAGPEERIVLRVAKILPSLLLAAGVGLGLWALKEYNTSKPPVKGRFAEFVTQKTSTLPQSGLRLFRRRRVSPNAYTPTSPVLMPQARPESASDRQSTSPTNATRSSLPPSHSLTPGRYRFDDGWVTGPGAFGLGAATLDLALANDKTVTGVLNMNGVPDQLEVVGMWTQGGEISLQLKEGIMSDSEPALPSMIGNFDGQTFEGTRGEFRFFASERSQF